MPKLCEILTFLATLPERGIATGDDERVIKAIRRLCIMADTIREKLEELVKRLQGEGG